MEEKKHIFVDYIFTAVIIFILKHQRNLATDLSDNNAVRLEETAIGFIKATDG